MCDECQSLVKFISVHSC